MKPVALALALLAAAACGTPETPAPKPAAPATATSRTQPAPDEENIPIHAEIEDIDGDNLLNMAYGASVVSRTGEQNLETSAVHAIDGMAISIWSSSPGAPAQTLVLGLGGPSRIQKLGVTTNGREKSPETVQFDASSDGKSWKPILSLKPSTKGTTINEVTPFEARYLRVSTGEAPKYYAALASIHAIGSETEPPQPQSLDGCWMLNTQRAALLQNGARVTGVLEGRTPTFLDGGIDGRVVKLMWMRGPLWGHAAATLTPDGQGFSAVTFHETPILANVGEAWMGRRCGEALPAAPVATNPGPSAFLRRVGHWTMSGIVFDAEERLLSEPSKATLDDAAALLAAVPAAKLRIVAREFRNNDSQDNLRRTETRIEAVRNALKARGVDLTRIQFAAKGSESIGVDMPSALQRMLWSRIDLELVK